MLPSFPHLLIFLTSLPLTPTALAVGPNAKANSLSYSGTGCPQGTSSFQLTETRIIIGFEEFQPSIGPGVAPAQQRKTCTYTLDMSVDAGWKYRINGVETELRGFMALEGGRELGFWAGYGFPDGGGMQSTTQFSIVGPQRDDPFVGRGGSSPAGGVTSPCGGGVLNATYQVALSSSSSAPMGGIDTFLDDTAWTIGTSVEWLKC